MRSGWREGVKDSERRRRMRNRRGAERSRGQWLYAASLCGEQSGERPRHCCSRAERLSAALQMVNARDSQSRG